MKIPNVNVFLLSTYAEPVVKVSEHFYSLQFWSLGVCVLMFYYQLIVKFILGKF